VSFATDAEYYLGPQIHRRYSTHPVIGGGHVTQDFGTAPSQEPVKLRSGSQTLDMATMHRLQVLDAAACRTSCIRLSRQRVHGSHRELYAKARGRWLVDVRDGICRHPPHQTTRRSIPPTPEAAESDARPHLQQILDILRSGQLDQLVGAIEDEIMDAKSEAYQLDIPNNLLSQAMTPEMSETMRQIREIRCRVPLARSRMSPCLNTGTGWWYSCAVS
jgi:hypothetical protein